MECREYKTEEHFDLICNWLDEGYYKNHLDMNYILRTRWEYLHAFTIFPFGTFNRILLWFDSDKLVAILISERSNQEFYLLCNDVINIDYDELVSDVVSRIDLNFLLFVDEKNIKLKKALFNAGFKKTEKREVERQMMNRSFAQEKKGTSLYYVERFKKEHINSVAKLLCESYSDTQSKNIIKKNLTHMFKQTYFTEQTHFLLFKNEEPNVLVSYCGFWVNKDKNYAMIEPLVTHPLYQKKHLSTMIVYEGMSILSNEGISCFNVTSEHEFYEKIGFDIIGTRVGYCLTKI